MMSLMRTSKTVCIHVCLCVSLCQEVVAYTSVHTTLLFALYIDITTALEYLLCLVLLCGCTSRHVHVAANVMMCRLEGS